jgi:hypothetical protein
MRPLRLQANQKEAVLFGKRTKNFRSFLLLFFKKEALA